MALGGLAVTVLSALEGAVAFGGSSAIGAAIYSMGVPKDSVLEYERALKADSFLILVHGTAGDVARAKSVLASVKPTHLDVHEGVTLPAAQPAIGFSGRFGGYGYGYGRRRSSDRPHTDRHCRSNVAWSDLI